MKNKMNDSVYLLAKALRTVVQDAVQEAVEGGVEPLTRNVGSLRKEMGEMEGRLTDRIDTINGNMQVQFDEQEKKIGKMLNSVD